MVHLLEIFKMAAGIGLFIFAMYLLEESLKNLSGRNFKLFLQKMTKTSIGGVAGGALITAILQSSSIVTLMVLAFVGAGVFSMKNAMSIILGANLGTTLSSWMVASLGFRFNIEILAYPAVFIGGMLLIIAGSKPFIKYLSLFLVGFGLLFIALSFMKTAMEIQVKNFDLSAYSQMPLIVFLILGFVLTVVVQSSSVTMALSLSAIHAGAIGFLPAAAIILGSETGTTIKILVGAIGGNAAKKRVALGHFIFNVFIMILAFIFIKNIVEFISINLAVKDPILGLVTFSSLTNLLAILIFLPLLGPFTQLLQRAFKDTDTEGCAYIKNVNIKEPETALDLFKIEVEYFIHNCILFNLEHFGFKIDPLDEKSKFRSNNIKKKYTELNSVEKYSLIKQHQGELQAFYIEFRNHLKGEQLQKLSRWISSVRSAMYSVKGIKDIDSNISNLSRSSHNYKFGFYIHHQKESGEIYTLLHSFLINEKPTDFLVLQNLYIIIQENYTTALNNFYTEAQEASINQLDITTIINFNRELFTSNKALLMSIKDLLLDEKQAEEFNEILVYKT
jgi:phosphate:Na+ symporter